VIKSAFFRSDDCLLPLPLWERRKISTPHVGGKLFLMGKAMMKRFGGLYDRIASFENLRRAAYRARRGKRRRPDVVRFHHYLEANLLDLREKLLEDAYRPGPYHAFPIRDPKPRVISAASYRDRVVHHAICQIIEPLLEPTFIFDSYANRVDKGTHAALDRCTAFANRYRFVFKGDIEKFFPSIDHEILLALLARKLKCPRTLNLLRLIIENSNPQEPVVRYFPGDNLFTPYERHRGIPIGNLTSQFFANVYLNGFDHFVKEELRVPGYLRFADDFLLFADSLRVLRGYLPRIEEYLNTLRLRLHPSKCQVFPTRCGVEFLGWQVFRDHRRLRRSTGVRFQRQLRKLREDYASGAMSLDRVEASVRSWIGHLQHGDTYGLRRKLLREAPFVRHSTQPRPAED